MVVSLLLVPIILFIFIILSSGMPKHKSDGFVLVSVGNRGVLLGLSSVGKVTIAWPCVRQLWHRGKAPYATRSIFTLRRGHTGILFFRHIWERCRFWITTDLMSWSAVDACPCILGPCSFAFGHHRIDCEGYRTHATQDIAQPFTHHLGLF